MLEKMIIENLYYKTMMKIISKLNIIINHKVKIIICVPNVILLMNNMLKQLKIIIINT
jgi:hypothetical protein